MVLVDMAMGGLAISLSKGLESLKTSDLPTYFLPEPLVH